jgi:hypothetical protein
MEESAIQWTDVVSAVGTAGGALVAGLAIFYAGKQVKYAREAIQKQDAAAALARQHARQQVSFGYLERFQSPQMHRHIAEWSRFILLKGVPPDHRWSEWTNMDHEKRLAILTIPNFLEELAGIYNADAVDREAIRKFFRGWIVYWWESGQWFIERQRGDNPEVLEEWRLMYVDIKARQEAEIPSPPQGV